MGDHLDTTDMSQKLGAMPPFGGAGSPSNTMWPGLRPTCMPNFILIHPAVWPQYTNITDRQDRTDRQENDPIAYSEPFDKWSPKKETWPPWFLQQLPLFQVPQILYFLPRHSGRPVQRCPDNYSICTPMPVCSLVKCNHATASIRCCSSRIKSRTVVICYVQPQDMTITWQPPTPQCLKQVDPLSVNCSSSPINQL